MFDDMSKSTMIKDMVEEVVDVIGFTAKYLPRKYKNLDPVFGEDPTNALNTILEPSYQVSPAVVQIDSVE